MGVGCGVSIKDESPEVLSLHQSMVLKKIRDAHLANATERRRKRV